MHRVVLALLLAILGLTCPRGTAADEAFERLRALDDEEHAQHAEAVAWWEGLKPARQIGLLRQALGSVDDATARLAAQALGHPYLEAAELRRKVALQLEAPASVFGWARDWGHDGENALGSPEVVAYVRAAIEEPAGLDTKTIATAHRVTRGEHVRELLPLLERAPPDLLRDVLFLIANLGETDRADRFRPGIARGLYYGLQRIRAIRAGDPTPSLDDVPLDVTRSPAGGLPTAAIVIARAAQADARNGFARTEKEAEARGGDEDAAQSVRPYFWIQRWLLSLTPNRTDVEFLHDVVRRGLGGVERSIYTPALVHWAMGHLADLPGPSGRASVHGWAKGADGPLHAWYASVALAKRGNRVPFDKLRDAADRGDMLPKDMPGIDFTWFVDRDDACKRVAEDLRTGEDNAIDDRHELTPEERILTARYEGLLVDEADLDAIAVRLWGTLPEDGPQGVRRLAEFHAHVHPAGLTATRSAKLLAGLRTVLQKEVVAWKWESEEAWARILALLEVRDPKGTEAFLRWWVATVVDGRDFALDCLVRFGAEGLGTPMIARWRFMERRWLLGRIRSKTIGDFLAGKAIPDPGDCTPEEMDDALDALHALMIRDGLPVSTRPLFEALRIEAVDDPETYARTVADAWNERARGDAVQAILTLAEVAPYGIHALTELDDRRVLSFLRDRQVLRHLGHYWEATAALARTHVAAADELFDLLVDGRTWVLGDLDSSGVANAPRRPLTDILTRGLDTNCCLAWICHVLLKQAYPWLPFGDGFGGVGTTATRAYLAAHTWRHSRIFGGLVPGLP